MDDVLKSKVDSHFVFSMRYSLSTHIFDVLKMKGFRWIVAYAFEVDGGMRGRYMYL